MKKIIITLNPFDLIQTCYVYQNDKSISVMQGDMAEIPNIILTLSKKYNVNEVDFFGIKGYAENIAKETREIEKTKYNMNTLKFKHLYASGKEGPWENI